MNITQAADACGLPVKTLRHHENEGLVVPARAPGNDYRVYTLDQIEQLRFLQRARACGFSLSVCSHLLLFDQGVRNAQGYSLVEQSLAQAESQLLAVTAMHQTLLRWKAELEVVSGKSANIRPAETHMPFMLLDPPIGEE